MRRGLRDPGAAVQLGERQLGVAGAERRQEGEHPPDDALRQRRVSGCPHPRRPGSSSRRGDVDDARAHQAASSLRRQVERDVDDHVFLAADQPALAAAGAGSRGPGPCSARRRARRAAGSSSTPRPSPARSRCGPSSASGAGTAARPPRPRRAAPSTSTPVVDAHPVEHRRQHLGRRVARAGTQRAQRAVDHRTPTSAAITEFATPRTCSGGRGSRPTPRRRPRPRSASKRALRLVHEQRAGRVGDVRALAAGVDHDPGLLGQLLRGGAVRHHQEARRSPCPGRGRREVLRRDVGLGAVRGDAHHARAGVVRAAQVVDGADAGHQQHRDRRRRGLLARPPR